MGNKKPNKMKKIKLIQWVDAIYICIMEFSVNVNNRGGGNNCGAWKNWLL